MTLTAGALAALVPTPPARAAFPGENGKIVFQGCCFKNTTLEIFVMEPDGSGVTRLTRNRLNDSSPEWSPDGTKIAFSATGGIFVMNPDGSGVEKIAPYGGPSWSPDGTRFVFQGPERGGDLSVISIEDGSVRPLTRGPADDELPVWSPDGTRIAFERTPRGPASDTYITVINADGTGIERLRPGLHPAWSPDGTKIAFDDTDEDGDIQIFTMNSDGTGLAQLTDDDGVNFLAEWSPDGTRIVFQKSAQIYVMNADGSDETFLANGTRPDWQPLCSIYGTPGDDSLEGTPGDDLICAGEGDDLIFGSDGDDRIIGGLGTDTVSYEGAPAGVRVDLARGRATGWGTDALLGVDAVVGSPFPDTIRGSPDPDLLSGGAGEDRLAGRGGEDRLVGGPGVDSVAGGPGHDRLGGGAGADVLAGGHGPDSLWGGLGDDRLDGGPGTDRCLQGAGAGPELACER